MVLRPMKIFSLRVIARRTSFSLTKTCISVAVLAAGPGLLLMAVAGLAGIGACAVSDVAEVAAVEVTAACAFEFEGEPKKRSAISAAMDDGLGDSFAA